jgi:proteic killer suppression protein
VIRSFRDKATALVFAGGLSRGMARDLAVAARRKLAALDAAERLDDLRVPPGNRLEALRGNRAGQHSIRITASGVSPLCGGRTAPTRSRLWTTISR